ncbi:hypothetical protein A2U01_0041417 [Trifolium medium]|uniref:Uncharacterized protein n=1 Tax=Trifolium medium TaxID=97028 RepID=A0A392QAG4_9FABA|nr:hypothetical protein [Trifolium medium]
MQLGVERLVLPAVPSVADTWTEYQQKHDAISGSSTANKSPVSEVDQAGEINKKEMQDQQMLEYVSSLSI